MKMLMPAILIVLLTACAGMTKKECQSLDWSKEGYHFALYGWTKKKSLDYHYHGCESYHGVKLDKEAILKGYEKGIKKFCDPKYAKVFGRAGRSYNGTCPKTKEVAFKKEYIKGENIFLKDKIKKLETKVSKLNTQIYKLKHKKK